MKQPTVRPYDVATKKLHHNDKDLKHFSQVFSMQFMAKFGACQEKREEHWKFQIYATTFRVLGWKLQTDSRLENGFLIPFIRESVHWIYLDLFSENTSY